MTYKQPYTIDDFKIGESVVPLNAKELTLVIVSIDKERAVIICRLASERAVHAYFPQELEKENIVRPISAMDIPKPEKDDATEKQEE